MKDILLSEYLPVSELVVEQHEVTKPKFSVIDFHTHYSLNYFNNTGKDDIANEVRRLREYGVAGVVCLGNYWEKDLEEMIKVTSEYNNFFITFGSVDVTKVSDPNFSKYATSVIREGYKRGMRGLKFFKSLGLKSKDSSGKFIRPDDERLKPIWETAGELNIPVLIHIADPVAFFKPVDRYNERFEELNVYPDWSYASEEFFRFDELMEMQEILISSNRNTTFVIVHVGSMSENLKFVSQQLDRYPNMYVDISARIAELGRQPYTARKFMLKHQDRILFGTDGSSTEDELYPYYYRFLETWDEYFDYYKSYTQGRWKIYGIGLPEEVLRKIYYENAIKLVPEFSCCCN